MRWNVSKLRLLMKARGIAFPGTGSTVITGHWEDERDGSSLSWTGLVPG